MGGIHAVLTDDAKIEQIAQQIGPGSGVGLAAIIRQVRWE